MSAPTITARTPSASETNVYINQLIYITFDQAMTSSTLNSNTIVLYRTSDYEVLDTTISYNSSTYKVTVTPDVIFDQNTSYNVVVVGLDQSSTCVKNASNEGMTTTATWYFTTGTEIYEAPEDTVPETQPDVEVAGDAATKILEPAAVTDFSIVSTSPENYNSNLGSITNTTLGTVYFSDDITITFNRLVASGVSVSQDWITISAESVDGDPALSTSVPSGVLSNDTGNTLTWSSPTYSLNEYAWYTNNEITVTISEDVLDYQGNVLGDDYQFMFTTAYRPLYSSVKKIRTVIGPFIRDLNDDIINRNIYLNSIEAYNIANVIYNQSQWDIDSPTFAAKMWVSCKTQYDLLYAKLLDLSSSGSSQLKRLGDFTIQDGVDIRESISGAIQKALACTNAWFKQLLGRYRRAKAKMAVKGVSSDATPPMRGVRTWRVPSEAEGIGGNKRVTREIKSPGPYEEWS